jgi:signal transduction histidine kinase
MNWSLERKLIAGGFSLTMLLLGFFSFLSYQITENVVESTEQLKYRHEILENLMEITAILNEAESGRRGYILLKEKSELKRYQIAIQQIDPTIDRLQHLFEKKSQNTQKQLAKLEKLIERRLELSQTSLELYEQGVFSSLIPSPLTAQSQQIRNQINLVINQMRQDEEKALSVWVEYSRSSIQYRMLIEILGTLFTFFILFWIYAMLHRQILKRHQAEIQQQKLIQEKEMGELKLEFFSMASHEFRTPLSIILGSSQLLEGSLKSVVDKQKLKNLHRIQTSARLMTQLLSDILTLARAEAGKLEYKPELVEIQSFCLNLIEDIQTISQSQHTIKFENQGICTHAWLDEKLLYSILSNLLSNAIKYSHPNQEIYFILNCQPDNVIFEVKDKGIGISKDTQLQLYEPFQRGKNAAGILGTGLGLAVVKKCLDLHQGEISVASEVGLGTTFTVTIPQQKKRLTKN